MTEVLDRAIDLYKRRRFLEGLNTDFAALRKHKALWEEGLAERECQALTLADGFVD
jgi:hypothetical protein